MLSVGQLRRLYESLVSSQTRAAAAATWAQTEVLTSTALKTLPAAAQLSFRQSIPFLEYHIRMTVTHSLLPDKQIAVLPSEGPDLKQSTFRQHLIYLTNIQNSQDEETSFLQTRVTIAIREMFRKYRGIGSLHSNPSLLDQEPEGQPGNPRGLLQEDPKDPAWKTALRRVATPDQHQPDLPSGSCSIDGHSSIQAQATPTC